jgi:excisionase family DNA binding protein
MQPEQNGDELWSVEEVANHFRVTQETVRRWVRAGRLKAIKPGGGKTSPLRVAQAEVDKLAGYG